MIFNSIFAPNPFMLALYTRTKIKDCGMKFLTSSIKATSFILLVGLILISSVQQSAAVVDRVRTCTPAGGTGAPGSDVTVEGLQWGEPIIGGGPDFEFEVDNPVCLAVFAISYVAVKSSIVAMNSACGLTSNVSVTPSLLQDAVDITKAGIQLAKTKSPACLAGMSGAGLAMSSFAVQLKIINDIAKDVFLNSRLCGSDWKRWNSQTMFKDIPNVQQNRNDWVKNPVNAFVQSGADPMTNKTYREWYYGGKEYIDKDNICLDVTQGSIGSYPAQQYYMRGTETPNYNCEKYNINKIKKDPLKKGSSDETFTAARIQDYETAYNCCVSKMRKSVCIEYRRVLTSDYEYKFCQAGDRCTIEGITFSAGYKLNNSLICVSTYSLCPYNFNIGGGSTQCDYFQDGVKNDNKMKFISPEDVASGNCKGKTEVREDNCTMNNKAGKCRNYCQMLENCVITNSSYNYESSITSPYFSRACIDFVGDSRNNLGYDSGIFAGNQMHFTAPIAQCVRETLENVFYNRAGHSSCLNGYEVADENGKCFSETYVYKQGSNVQGKSFFAMLQNATQSIVKMVLTLMITLTGVKILLGGQFLKRSELVMLVFKVAVVAYFATGDAWKTTYFNAVYNGSTVISQLVMKINVNQDASKQDGCQFGKIKVTSGTIGNAINIGDTVDFSVKKPYPEGKEYLAVWDTFDCKIARYLGYGPTSSVANIAKLILAGFFTGPIGIYFSVLLLIFGFYMVLAALRALHIFLASAMSIILMVYISVITIPTMLFKKTESIFKNWLNNLIGFSLQPVMLFAYIGIFITVFDQMMIGSATFTGAAPSKTIVCDKKCYDQNGQIVTHDDGTTLSDAEVQACAQNDLSKEVRDPNTDSVACILGLDKVDSWPGFEIFGISLPLISDLTNKQEKILTLMKGALLIYILGEFIEQIPAIESSLMGGGLKTKTIKIQSIIKGASGALRSVQKRGQRGGMKAAKSLGNKSKEAVRQVGSKETKVDE